MREPRWTTIRQEHGNLMVTYIAEGKNGGSAKETWIADIFQKQITSRRLELSVMKLESWSPKLCSTRDKKDNGKRNSVTLPIGNHIFVVCEI
jgi:hypothetical protein